MRLLFDSARFDPKTPYPVVTLGNFDGVHLGHQEIFRRVRDRATAAGGRSVVYTFEPHPTRVLAPHHHLPMLQTREQKTEMIADLKMDMLIIESFTPDFAKMTADDFLEIVVKNRLHPACILVGYDFTFGVHRSGTVEKLHPFGRANGIEIEIIDPLFYHETLLSSTHIRLLIEHGNLAAANAMLGRAYEICGVVESRRGIGKQLGIPTANLKPESDLIPGFGVYVTETVVDNHIHPSVTNIGFNPTVGGSPLSIETHILDFTQSLVEKKIRLRFHQKIRNEKKFANTDELVAEIKRDIGQARDYYAKRVS